MKTINLFWKMMIPSRINHIKPRITQVWNCNKIGFDQNGRWNKVICTYKLVKGDCMWKAKTGDQEPLWCKLLVFNRSDGQCFMTPIIVHQDKEYSQDLHFNISLDWKVHHTPYGHIYREGYLKATTQLSNWCGSPLLTVRSFSLKGTKVTVETAHKKKD